MPLGVSIIIILKGTISIIPFLTSLTFFQLLERMIKQKLNKYNHSKNRTVLGAAQAQKQN
jgi:hypothetical protein